MTTRCVIVLLTPPAWAPPGVDPGKWRAALAEDMVDLVAGLAETDAAVAAPPDAVDLVEAVRWPTMKVYPATSPLQALAAAAGDGYDLAAVLAPDVPDLPAMLVGKLLRPLSSRDLAVAPAVGGGLYGIAARLAGGVPDLDWSSEPPPEAAVTTPWHRLDSPAGFGRLDEALEGWDATRALLS
ncbi:hypothetical protein AB0M43_32995 [Longispora sp. NPDC051575]|uniref:hypothetical protein n=1 Tax=Longispora sp. NPDC051575 TaxID=3154943 RepID=UPI0034422370